MSMTSFDELGEQEDNERRRAVAEPFWKVDIDDDKEVISWAFKTFSLLKKASHSRDITVRQNIAAYRGQDINNRSQVDRERAFTDSPKRSRIRNVRIGVNNLYDIIEQNVSRETRYRPATSFTPGDSFEHDDMMASDVVEKVNDGIWNREKIDLHFQKHSRISKICGEAYLFIGWNKYKGTYHPDYLKALWKKAKIKGNPEDLSEREVERIIRDEIKKVPKISVTKQDGEKITIENPLRIGQEFYRNVLPVYFLLEPRQEYEDCQFAFFYEYVHIDELKRDFPDTPGLEVRNDELDVYDYDNMEEKRLDNHVMVMHMWHKNTDKVPGGRYLRFTESALMINEENEFASCEATGGFPWVRRVDVKIPGQLFGAAALEFGRPLAEWISKLTSMLIRQQALVAHPKWAAPVNSVKAETLGNDTTLMWYKGAIKPELIQPNPGGSNTFNLIEILDKKLQQIMGVFGISRGEPPAGVKAGVAMQFLNEQENERANSQIQDHNSNIAELARLTIYQAGRKYHKSDGRLVRLLGPQHAALAEYFDMSNLTRTWDVKAQTASALPQQKAQRIQTLLDLKERFPEKVDDDEVLDMIGFGNADKFITVNTSNVRCAEAENDSLLRAGKADAPEAWEDHMKHYRIHLRKLVEPELKNGMVAKNKVNAIKEHLGMHEMFMVEILGKNPQYGKVIYTEFPLFPMFFKAGEELLMMQQAAMMEQSGPGMAAGGGAQARGSVQNPEAPSQEMPPAPNEMPAGMENITPVGAV